MSSFAADSHAGGGAVVVSLSGDLDLATVDYADAAFRQAARESKLLVVDLRQLDFIGVVGLRLMLAADEFSPTDMNAMRATGYLARQYFLFNRTTWMDETVEHTAKAFLGLTMNCCKCHDHKYDPVRQDDYYRFRAFFEPYQVRAEMVPGQVDFEKDAIPTGFDCHLLLAGERQAALTSSHVLA